MSTSYETSYASVPHFPFCFKLMRDVCSNDFFKCYSRFLFLLFKYLEYRFSLMQFVIKYISIINLLKQCI